MCDHRAIRTSEPYASADLGTASDFDRQVLMVRGCAGLFAGCGLTSNPATPSSLERQAMTAPDRQHRFRWKTTWGLSAATRAICPRNQRTTLAENDRTRASLHQRTFSSRFGRFVGSGSTNTCWNGSTAQACMKVPTSLRDSAPVAGAKIPSELIAGFLEDLPWAIGRRRGA